MSLDEPTTALLAQLADSGTPALHEMTPEQARGLGTALAELYGAGPDMARVDNVRAGPVPIRVLVPDDTCTGILVYYHGGGWTVGTIDEFDTLGRILARRTGCAVALVDYRLAPEHRYPAAVDDAWTGLLWVSQHVRDIAASDVPLIVAGDSAGGGLAAIMARRARDEGGPDIAMQVLVCPVTDCDLDTPSYVDPVNQLIVGRETMTWFWGHYLPDTSLRVGADASPLRVADLSNLPPAVVLTAEHDVLRDEGERYAQRLHDARVPVLHRRFHGQMHDFFLFVNVLPGSAEGIDFAGEAIEKHLAETADQPRTAHA